MKKISWTYRVKNEEVLLRVKEEKNFLRTLRRTKIHRSDISDVPPRQSRDVQLPS